MPELSIKKSTYVLLSLMVRMKGLEPPCRKALDPKSSASASFATSAGLLYYNNTYSEIQ